MRTYTDKTRFPCYTQALRDKLSVRIKGVQAPLVLTSSHGVAAMLNETNAIRYGDDGEIIVDEEMLRDMYRQIKRDRLFLESHYSEWLQLYPDMFVAVYQEQFVGAAPTARGLAEQLRESGVPTGRSYWRFLSSEPVDLALPG